ncbi:MAG: hypothetical protein JNL58_00795 [Planctomyces sp.]|nr:hypothetical protein [Planctomyces sp.]
MLTFGLPWISDECSRRWIGPRLFLWPADAVAAETRISILSSRLGLDVAKEQEWFRRLRDCLRLARERRATVLTAESATAHQFLAATADALSIDLWVFKCRDRTNSITTSRQLDKWICDSTAQARNPAAGYRTVFVSPVLQPLATEDFESRLRNLVSFPHGFSEISRQPDSELPTYPVADRLLMAAATEIHILRQRNGGFVGRLAELHVEDPERCLIPIHKTEMSSTPSRSSKAKSGNRKNCQRGSIEKNSDHTRTAEDRPEDHSVFRSPEEWLLHWTRSFYGPWPGQTRNDWLREVVLTEVPADHSASGTLYRILDEQRIRASSSGIRGNYNVVCFTEVPLNQFRSLRAYRKHRNRYDFVPFGIAIRRSKLEATGAKPVIYGDQELWQGLSDSERPWFQLGAGSPEALRNRIEREWRVQGDVLLDTLDQQDVCVFVDQESDIWRFRKFTCDVVIVPGVESKKCGRDNQ